MAPERIAEESLWYALSGPSKESDVYSLAMASFEVCSSVVDHPASYLIQLPRSDQILTGILPCDDTDCPTIAWRIKSDARPSRPTDPSQNQWLRDCVWNVITTGWRKNPKLRCELSAMHRVFSTSDKREDQNGKSGDSDPQNGGNPHES